MCKAKGSGELKKNADACKKSVAVQLKLLTLNNQPVGITGKLLR